MPKLTTDGIFYHVDGQRIDSGMTVQSQGREGKIHMRQGLFYLHAEGVEPVALNVGDTVRIVTEQELHNRKMEEYNRHAPKYGDPGYDGEETRSLDGSNEGW